MSLDNFESKYPLIFSHCQPRGGPGWEELFKELLDQLQARADAGGIQARAQKACEKWGRLSLRFHPLDAADAALVAQTESLSLRTCEVCGRPGRLIEEGWYRTRCENHLDFRPTWP